MVGRLEQVRAAQAGPEDTAKVAPTGSISPDVSDMFGRPESRPYSGGAPRQADRSSEADPRLRHISARSRPSLQRAIDQLGLTVVKSVSISGHSLKLRLDHRCPLKRIHTRLAEERPDVGCCANELSASLGVGKPRLIRVH